MADLELDQWQEWLFKERLSAWNQREEQEVAALCERMGYGRVAQLALALWEKKDPARAKLEREAIKP